MTQATEEGSWALDQNIEGALPKVECEGDTDHHQEHGEKQ